MAKYTPSTIGSGYNSNAALNAEFEAIATELNDKVLYRDNPTGESSPMQNDLDLNGFNILNQANPITVSGLTWEGPWTTTTVYQVGDIVENNGSSYICIVEHTAGVFATDLASVYWQVMVDNSAALPTQTSKAKKFLRTDGSTASWEYLWDTAITTGGTSTAYTASVGITGAYVTGEAYLIDFHTINGSNATLNLDGLGAVNLKSNDGITLAPGVLQGPHKVMYDGTNFVTVGFTPRLLYAATLGAAVTNIDVSGLNLDDHFTYTIEIEHVPHATLDTSIHLWLNGDNTDTNYYSQSLSAGSTTVTGARTNDAVIGETKGGYASFTRTVLSYATGRLPHATSECTYAWGSAVQNRSYKYSKVASLAANLTSIRFAAGEINGFKAGTKVRIYRGDV